MEKKAASPSSSQTIQGALTKLPKNTQTTIQNKIAKLNRGLDAEVLREIVLGHSPELCNDYVIAFIKVILWRMERDAELAKIKEPVYRRSMPVEILWSSISGEPSYTYDSNRQAQKFMAAITREVIDPLWKSRLIRTVPHNRKLHRCRIFNLKSLAKTLYITKLQPHMHPFDYNRLDDYQLPPLEVGKKKLPLLWSREKKKYMAITNETGEYLRNCKFRFENLAWKRNGLYWAKQFAELTGTTEESKYAKYGSIKNAIEGLDWQRDVQYTGQYRLQGPGRMHTIGGSIALPKPFRRLFISPVNRNNLVLELDLKSAQLVILSKILGCNEVLDAIRECNATGGSIWDLIRPARTHVPKRALKVLTYGLCFGADRKNLLFLCNLELGKTECNYRFTQKRLDRVLEGFLSPLVTRRDEWLAQYTNTELQKKGTKLRHKNALGLVFDAGKELKKYLEGCKKQGKKPVETKIAGRLLAHYAQGDEQFIMQSFIASDAMRENILSFDYDGCSVEVPVEYSEVTKRYDAWLKEFDSDHMFEYLPLWFKRNKNADGPDMLRDMLEEDWEEKYNQKPEKLLLFPD